VEVGTEGDTSLEGAVPEADGPDGKQAKGGARPLRPYEVIVVKGVRYTVVPGPNWDEIVKYAFLNDVKDEAAGIAVVVRGGRWTRGPWATVTSLLVGGVVGYVGGSLYNPTMYLVPVAADVMKRDGGLVRCTVRQGGGAVTTYFAPFCR
jgi:hypothetical protein